MNLSKSKYCQCVQCEKMIWLNKYKTDSAAVMDKEAIFETGRKVGELAKGLFGDYNDISFNRDYNVMIEKT